MRNAIFAFAVAVCGFLAAFAQTPAGGKLTFEVATIRPYTPPQGRMVINGGRGGPGSADPGRITRTGATLHDLLMTAYDVKRYQVTGPAWMDSERYDIVAKVPAGATKEQVKVMWQNLLADRFGVVFHREQKEFSVDELVVAKGGPKLKPTDVDPNAPPPGPPAGTPDGPPPPSAPPKLDANGFPQLDRPGLIVMISPGSNGQPIGHMVAKGRSIQELADFIGNEMNKPVVDKSGLTGRYDFSLEYTPDLAGRGLPPLPAGGPGAPAGVGGASTDAAEPGSNLSTAIQSLGLRLNSTKDKLDVLVIEKAEKSPTEN